MSFKAKKATVEMAEVLGNLHSKSWQVAYKGIISDYILINFTPKKRAEVFSRIMEDTQDDYYLFESDGRPAGFAILHESSDAKSLGEIYAIYFHPDFWGSNCTHKAMDFCLEKLKEMGCSKATVWVLEKNIRARKFYEKFGFVLNGNKKEIFIGKNLTEVKYERNI